MSVDWKKKKLIVIAGPTAAGKTATSIQLARHYHSEIISADSRQLFKEMNIGTAKPSPDELAVVPHHFISSHSIHDDYDAARFGIEAREKIYALFQYYDYVIVCGGSGLYIQAVLTGFDDIPEIDPAIREQINASYSAFGLSWLQDQMKLHDPEHYQRIDQQNPHRMIRALEVMLGTGESISAFHKKNQIVHPFTIIKVGLTQEREILYQRIDSRMDEMIARGLFAEALSLYPLRVLTALQTVGYQEIFRHLDGAYDEVEAIRLLKQNSRRYAKRQLTWFRRDTEMKWFEPAHVKQIIQYIDTFKE